jgi:hypothetical protein
MAMFDLAAARFPPITLFFPQNKPAMSSARELLTELTVLLLTPEPVFADATGISMASTWPDRVA